jgi:hypothetical protein
MKTTLSKAYIFLTRVVLAFVFSFRIYWLWSKIYSILFIDKRTRRLLPNLYNSPHTPLARVSKVTYVPDGSKELWEVCQPPGVVEQRIIAIENSEKPDSGAMDCDEFARYLANSLESQLNPRLLSVICIDKRELKWGIIPKFPGHVVCLWSDSEYNPDASGNIYHIGNWNQIKSGPTPEYRNERHFSFQNLSEMAAQLVDGMTDGHGELLAWMIMDKDLKVCCWGMGNSQDLKDINSITISSIRPRSIIG